jgi:hypothetical protein
MARYYTLLFSIVLASCGTRINYLGNSSTPTRNVDVYVDASSIKKPYTIIGKGYINTVRDFYNLKKLQHKATELAKEKGADAILFQDYFITEDRANVYKTNTDSIGNRLIGVKSATVTPSVISSRNILFLKYD